MNPLLIKNCTAAGAVTEWRFVTWSTADGIVRQSAAVADAPVGVARETVADGARVDVIRAGISQITYGAAVTRGQPLTSDAQGRAVPVAAGTDRVYGLAEVSGVAGDLGELLLRQS